MPQNSRAPVFAVLNSSCGNHRSKSRSFSNAVFPWNSKKRKRKTAASFPQKTCKHVDSPFFFHAFLFSFFLREFDSTARTKCGGEISVSVFPLWLSRGKERRVRGGGGDFDLFLFLFFFFWRRLDRSSAVWKAGEGADKKFGPRFRPFFCHLRKNSRIKQNIVTGYYWEKDYFQIKNTAP